MFCFNLIAASTIAITAAIFFGVNSILDGYGNAVLLFYYFLVFFPVVFLLNSLLSLYGNLRKIHYSPLNNLLLLGSLLSSFAFYLFSYYIKKFIFKTIGLPALSNFLGYILPVFTLLFFVWLSGFHRKKVKKTIIILLTLCSFFICISSYIYGELYFKKKDISDVDGPNVLLVTIESLRYDHLGCSGNPKTKTPNIDALAKEAVVFDNYFVQGSMTPISLPTLITGHYPFNHGMRGFGQKYSPRFKPFFEELVKKGYLVETDLFLFPYRRDNSVFMKIYGKLTGMYYKTNDFLGDCIPFLFSRYNFGSSTSMSQTSKLLHRIRLSQEKKWFFWTHLLNNCHSPYEAPKHFINMYNNDADSMKTSWSIDEIIHLNDNPHLISRDILREIRTVYKAEVSCVDSQIGFMVNFLKRLNLFKKTIIIITSDHGEMLGSGGIIGHGLFLKDSLIRVPLIIYAPGSIYFKGGKRIDKLVEEVDIGPTILDLCGIDSEQKFDGKSLLNIFNSRGWDKDAIYSEISEITGYEKIFLACYRTKKYKLVWDGEKKEFSFFNIISDPGETDNLKGRYLELFTDMKKKFLEFVNCTNFDELKPADKPKISEELKEKLKSLGYID